jgi:hypothetical protein
MSARFAGIALIVSIVWRAAGWTSASISVGTSVLRVLGWTFGAAAVGKLIGIAWFRIHARRQRVRSISAKWQYRTAPRQFR